MSMNLMFDVVGGGHVDFPFQTPTNLTFAALGTDDVDERIAIIQKHINSLDLDGASWDGWAQSTMREVETLLRNTNLELTYI